MGLTETQAKADGTEVETAVFPWAASGRALGMGRPEGMTKLVLEPEHASGCSAPASSASTPAS